VVDTVTEGGGETLHVFATGSVSGPLRRAAQAFVLLHEGVTFEFTMAGASKLLPRMIEWKEGDLVCGGSESVMDAALMYGCVLSTTIRTIGARRSAILVPNGNPAEVRGLKDLTRDDVRVGVAMQGSLDGLWEAVAIRAGMLEAIRSRITDVSAAMLAPERIETVPIRDEWCTWRCTSLGVTPWSHHRPLAEEFTKFLRSPEGFEIWAKFGWTSLREAKLKMK
jgi:ABC-type molybdate transport system substrate-binding protein